MDVQLLTIKVMLLERYFKFHLIVKAAQMAEDMILWDMAFVSLLNM